MHSFVDNSRRTWEVTINVTAVKRVLRPVVPAREANRQAAAMAAARVRADQVQAQEADRGQVPVASVPAGSVPVALEVPDNRMDRAATAAARRTEAAVLVQRVDVAARVTTSGMGLAGSRLQCGIHASLKSALFRQLVSVQATSRPALARMWDKPFTQDVTKVCNE